MPKYLYKSVPQYECQVCKVQTLCLREKNEESFVSKSLPNHTPTDLCRLLKLSTMSVKLRAEESFGERKW